MGRDGNVKGQIVAGDYSKLIMRVKSSSDIELGEIVAIDAGTETFLLQVYDLSYSSQISSSNLEMISGMKLEDDTEFELADPNMRNYRLAQLKPLLSVSDTCKTCKRMPPFFAKVREVNSVDLRFITTPKNPLYLGELRSGSRTLGFDLFLPGKEVFSHHVLLAASTGKGKSLDGNEEVIIKKNGMFLIKSIREIVDTPDFKNSKVEVISMNHKNYTTEFKEVTDFVRHKAPSFMYKVIANSGREVMVTEDHNLYVLHKGQLSLLETQKISTEDYLPMPIQLDLSSNLKKLNLFSLLKNEKNVYVLYSKNIIKKMKTKEECVKILSKYYVNPLQRYNNFVVKKNKIKITILSELLEAALSEEDLKLINLTDQLFTVKLKAIYPLTKEFLQLLGYYTAEGYCPNDNTFKISCSDEEGKELLNNIFSRLNLNYFWIKKKGKNTDVGVSSSIFTKILIQLSLGRVSGEKRLPYFFMNLSNKDLAILLKTYFEGDGGVDKKKIIENKSFIISTTTKSKKLASDLCLALLKYKIFSRSKKMWNRSTNTDHKGNWYYRIKISGRSDLNTFLSDIGFQFSRKNNILKDKLNYKENTNVDVIPCDPKLIRKIRLALRLSQNDLSKLCGCSASIISAIESGKRRPSRTLITMLLNEFQKQISKIDHVLVQKLIIFSQSPSSEKLAELINCSLKQQNLTLFEFGKKSGLYQNNSKRYIVNDLNRIIVTKKVKNSPKIYGLGKFLLKNNPKTVLSELSILFDIDYVEWIEIVKKATHSLNFPHQAMKKEKLKLSYYARRLKSDKTISLKSLRELATLLVKYYQKMINLEPSITHLKEITNFRWDKVKEIHRVKYNQKYVYDLTVEDNHTFFAGHGGLFVHNSNLMKDILWDSLDKEYVGILVMDPHDEYYGRVELGLKDHPIKNKIVYYTPTRPPPGARSLVINLSTLKPNYFQGAIMLSDPQQQALYAYYRKFGKGWILALLEEKYIDGIRFHEDTIAVVKRKLLSLLSIDINNGVISCEGIFREIGGENTISDICQELEKSHTVIIDTSFFSGALEVMVASMVASETLKMYKRYKRTGELQSKPVVSIILEEAPRVLGKKVLEQGTNVFDTIAREGRKFQVGLVAITQLPSEIPKSVLANMNTKIILGIEMATERNAVIESSAQDLSDDARTIASLDRGEAIVSSVFTRFAVPLSIPFYPDFVAKRKKEWELKQGSSVSVTPGFMGMGQ